MRIRALRAGMLAASLVAASSAGPARADVTELDIFKTVGQTQTGAATFSPSTYSYDARLFFSAPGQFTTGTVVGASTGPLFSLTPSDPTTLASGAIPVANQAGLNSAFLPDTYTVMAHGGSSPTYTSTFTTPPGNNAFPTSTAGFTASTFSALQGLDASQSITLGLLPFVPASNATEADLFLSILNSSTNALVFGQAFLPASTTSILLAAGTLAPNTMYTFDIVYSDRISNNQQFVVSGFDNRTGGTFTTAAVPEPASLAMLGLGAAALLGRARRAAGGEKRGREPN